ncbi:hypothetical protein [Ruminococcus bicirculans (ex Wegman et al. 2014)]|uniref:hypothetical protein n=1 Tax=Ruminococcus bicirculans (ex Wegman et al. 2014) TaxID=1160721 RepID=UPI00307F96FF
MYKTGELVAQRIESYCRTWRLWIDNAEGEVIMGDRITSGTSTVQSTSISDDIELGAVCSQSWQLSIADSSENFLGKEYAMYFYLADFTSETTYSTLESYTYAELSKLTVEQISKLGEVLDGERIPLGRFTCVKSKKSGGNTEVTFADRLYFSDKVYKPNVTLPAWSKAIEDDICKQLGLQNGNDYTKPAKLRVKGGARLYGKGHIRLKTANFDFKINAVPKDTTMRQMLSYIASAQGEFGYVDRFGRYVRKWYGRPVKLLDNNTIDLPTLSERQNIIVGIVCNVSDSQTLRLGNTTGSTGRVLEFENPYMTSSLLQSLWHRIQGFSWYTTELFHRLGDPRFDIGDVVTYDSGTETFDIPITNLGFNFDGGLSADISAVGLSVEEQL